MDISLTEELIKIQDVANKFAKSELTPITAKLDKEHGRGLSLANPMETVHYCSFGQITDTLFEVGGQYRRNI